MHQKRKPIKNNKITQINISDAFIKLENKIHNVKMKEVLLCNVIIKRSVMRQCNDKKGVVWGNVMINKECCEAM